MGSNVSAAVLRPAVLPPTVRRLAAALVVALAAAACATNPVTGRQQLALISEQQEIQLGRQTDQQVVQQLGLVDDAELQRYVETVGKRLAADSERPDLPWTFRVVDDPSVNAFALPGGFIYLTRGIVTHLNNEAEMAAVLGHEIGHVTARHSVSRISQSQLASLGLVLGSIFVPELRNYGDLAQTGLQLLFLKYGRDDERQADDLGLRYMLDDGYDPRQMPAVFETLARVSQVQGQGRLPAWLSSHPAPEARAERISDEVAAAVAAAGPGEIDRREYLAQVDGLVFGENPREGFFRGNTFYHPELAFQITFPPGWQVSNQRQAVGAISPNNDAVVVLSLAGQGTPANAASQFFGQPGLARGNPWRGEIGGMEAVAAEFQVQQQQGVLQGLAAFVEHGGRTYQLLGYSAANRWGAHDRTVAASVDTFRRVRDPEVLNVEPRRIDVVTLPSAMTLREFARRYPSTVDLTTLALINQVNADTRLEAGLEVKRVVGGPR
ncbi:MAG TPA: M48 family metalloprotease [Thermoanaerobaculia bacterium]|nr:M48 family metalloprotease [Thermoanaerobaculia bacterium]